MISTPWHRLGLPRDIAVEFMGVFARFEFALKEAGRVRGAQGTWAQPDWEGFGSSIAAAGLFNRGSSRELAAACDYLLQNPPWHQEVDAQQQARWAPPAPPPQNQSDIEQLLKIVKTVRNNLFHGGKFVQGQPPSRDIMLVTCSLVVLDSVLLLDANVRREFLNG